MEGSGKRLTSDYYSEIGYYLYYVEFIDIRFFVKILAFLYRLLYRLTYRKRSFRLVSANRILDGTVQSLVVPLEN